MPQVSDAGNPPHGIGLQSPASIRVVIDVTDLYCYTCRQDLEQVGNAGLEKTVFPGGKTAIGHQGAAECAALCTESDEPTSDSKSVGLEV